MKAQHASAGSEDEGDLYKDPGSPQLIHSKKWGPQSYNHKEPNSVNKESKCRLIFPRASDKSPALVNTLI